jgi:hypothetical protein
LLSTHPQTHTIHARTHTTRTHTRQWRTHTHIHTVVAERQDIRYLAGAPFVIPLAVALQAS